MSDRDSYNTTETVKFLNGQSVDNLNGYGWYAFGKIHASYILMSYYRIKVVIDIMVTSSRADNDEISKNVSYFVNNLVKNLGERRPKIINETPPRIELVIKKSYDLD